MRKFLLFILLVSLFSVPAYAGQDGRVEGGVWSREGKVLLRGLKNLGGVPAEIITTPAREKMLHPRSWLLTSIPQLGMNGVVRVSSAVYDILGYPWMVPFTDDLTPLSEPMGLPEYPWQK